MKKARQHFTSTDAPPHHKNSSFFSIDPPSTSLHNAGGPAATSNEDPATDFEIFKNIENVVGMLNEAESRARKAKWDGGREEEDNDDLERQAAGDEEDFDFGFQDAIDKPIEEIEGGVSGTGLELGQANTDADKQFNFDDIIKKIENPSNVKKSFELRCRNDDDDEIFIVHDGEEEEEEDDEADDQDNLFVESPSLTFNIINDDKEKKKKEAEKEAKKETQTFQDALGSPSGGFEKIEFDFKDFTDAQDGQENHNGSSFNPFADTLANSEALPVTQKLVSVQIQDNYLNQISKNEDSATFTQKLQRGLIDAPEDAAIQQRGLLSQSVGGVPHGQRENANNAQVSIDTNSKKSSHVRGFEVSGNVSGLLQPEDVKSRLSSTVHQQKLQKRKQKKGGNLSIHKFDEATQRSIEDAVRQNLSQSDEEEINKQMDVKGLGEKEVDNVKSGDAVKLDEIESNPSMLLTQSVKSDSDAYRQPDEPESVNDPPQVAQKVSTPKSHISISIVEDHIKQSSGSSPNKKDSLETVDHSKSPEENKGKQHSPKIQLSGSAQLSGPLNSSLPNKISQVQDLSSVVVGAPVTGGNELGSGSSTSLQKRNIEVSSGDRKTVSLGITEMKHFVGSTSDQNSSIPSYPNASSMKTSKALNLPLGIDELNDREDGSHPATPGQDTLSGTVAKNDGSTGAAEFGDDEDDNILRQKQPVKLNIEPQKQTLINSLLQPASKTSEKNTLDDDEVASPTSPGSPLDTLTSPKFQDQESIELGEKIEKYQDYMLIDRFFGFLSNREGKESLNATLSGYFCGVTLIIISHQPKELLSYMQSNNYKLIDKMLQYVDDKSMCELVSKLLDEILKQLINKQDGNPTMSQENLANSFANLNDENSDQKLLQQSGQSSEKIDRDTKMEEKPSLISGDAKMEQMLSKSKNVIYTILSEKLGEDSDPLERLGAIEILLDLLKNKVCYQILTTKNSFQMMTQTLVSDCEDSKKHIYSLLKHLIQNYEKYERFEKRINIDNFDDEELMNSHSGSGSGILNRSKKSKGSRRQNQDVLKDIQESDLFQFIRVVVQEITSPEIETRYDQIQEAKQNQSRLPLGMFFISLIEFIEKASSVFSGFKNDMNKTLVDKDIFNFIFDIQEYYHNSDIFNKTVLKILTNILRSKSEDAPEMLKYLFEETKFLQFLVKNGPKCIQTEIKQVTNFENLSFSGKNLKNYQSGPGTSSGIAKTVFSPQKPKDGEASSEEKAEKRSQKSPEQSSQIIEESKPVAKSASESVKKFKVQIPAKNSAALQAHITEVCEVIVELSQSKSLVDKASSLVKSANEVSKEGANQSQSGEQSKSSEIVIEDDDQHLEQTISKIVSLNVNENSEWLSFVSNQVQPISKLLKGKLCEDQNNSTSGFMNSDNNIFDDDFMRSNSDEDKPGVDQLQKLSNDFDNIISSVDGSKGSTDSQGSDQKGGLDQKDVVDHRKFYKKMQQCLSSNLNKLGAVGGNTNIIDTHEREMKQLAFSNGVSASLTENLKASLGEQSPLGNLDDLSRDPNQNYMFSGGRERSTSNEFCLPPLQDFNDHRDQANQNDQNLNNLLNAYKSNEKGQKMQMDPDLSAIAQVDDEVFSSSPDCVGDEDGPPIGSSMEGDQAHQMKSGVDRMAGRLSNEMQLDDVDINLDDSDEDGSGKERSTSQFGHLTEDEDAIRNFDDFANSLDMAISDGKNVGKNTGHQKKANLTIDAVGTNSNNNAYFKNQKGFGDIFEKIDEFDSLFGTISPTMKAAPVDPFGEPNSKDPNTISSLSLGNMVDSDQNILGRSSGGHEIPMGRNSFGINKSEIVVQINKLSIGLEQNNSSGADEDDHDPFASSPQSDKLPEDQEIEGFFSERVENMNNLNKAQMKRNDIGGAVEKNFDEDDDENDFGAGQADPEDEDNIDFNERLDECQDLIEPPMPRRNSIRKDTNDLVESSSSTRRSGGGPGDPTDDCTHLPFLLTTSSRNLSKSVYVQNSQKILDELDEYNQEYGDNQFWKIDNQNQQNCNVDDLLKELQD